MNRPLSLVFALVLLPAAASAEQTTVYKTKDANGNTVYSQVDSGGAQAQQVTNEPPAPAEEADTPKTDTEIACERAQANLKLIESGNRLQRDKNGDGTPEDLSAEEIASEKDLAQRQASAYCTTPPQD